MAQPDDHQLMQALQSGSPQALAELFTRHHDSVFSFFRRLGHSHADAEDLLQETFMRMLRYAGSFSIQGHFPAWMFRIARNVAHDAWDEHAASGSDAQAEHSEIAAPRQMEPEYRHQQSEVHDCLQRALLALPRDRRELVLLSRIRGLGMEELAALSGCSLSAVKVRLHRSLEQLKDYMKQHEQHDKQAAPIRQAGNE